MLEVDNPEWPTSRAFVYTIFFYTKNYLKKHYFLVFCVKNFVCQILKRKTLMKKIPCIIEHKKKSGRKKCLEKAV